MEWEHCLSSPSQGMLWERTALAKVLIPTHHPSCSTSGRSWGRTTKGPGEALGASGKEATGAEGGDVQTKRAEGFFFFPLENPFQKGAAAPRVVSGWFGRGTARSVPQGQVRSPGLSTGCVGIQVKQGPVPDQERGAWKIPSIYSGLVSPSGVVSVYLFFSREHRGALTVTEEQKDWHRAGMWPLFSPCSKKNLPTVLPGFQPLERLGPGNAFP